MRSMTGFGRGEANTNATSVVVELRSVNNRFRDVQLRVPREYNAFEPRVNGLLKDAVQRGRIDVTVRRTCTEGATRIVADTKLLEQYRMAVADAARKLQRDAAELPLEFLLAQPGVLVATDNDAGALSEWDLVEAAVQAALGELETMRAAEGAALANDLRRHLDELLRCRAEIAAAADGVAERLRQRLQDRIAKLLGGQVDASRVAQEAAILADKADVSEELQRLGAHVEQFQEALQTSEPVGRKLDFLVQEMHREVNTIGSKAAELPISARVVELKSVIERIREQVANVE
jgi:uncharacterized protein (TIGR00255 family)